jgi:putative ABC transport system substrate-binding protein
MRRRTFVAGVAATAFPFAAFSQQPAKVYRVGFLGTASASGYLREVEWIRTGLRSFGYEEGKNLVIEWRWADSHSEQMRVIVAEFVALKVDAILTHNTIGATTARRVTTTVPIVMADGSDPVASGLAQSLAHPARNVTGSTSFIEEEAAKRLEILKQVVPRARRVAFLSTANYPMSIMAGVKRALQKTAAAAKVEVHDFVVRDAQELPQLFQAIAKAEMDGVVVNNEPTLNAQASVVAALASVTRLPSIGYPSFADAGGFLAYGANRPALYGRAGYFLDRIFKGANPGEIPFEQARKFDFVINMKTGKALGLTVPQPVRLRADRVIE